MSQSNKFIRLTAKLIILSFGLTLAACGGGGGGGGSVYPSISYTGSTSEATVTEDNADDFPVTILEGGTSSAEANPYGAVLDENISSDAQHTAMLSILAEQVKNTISERINSADSNIVSAATQTISGTCTSPGSMTITDNSTQTNLSGSFTYDNFCVGDLSSYGFELVQHGKINYSGTYTIDTATNLPIFNSMTISIEYLKLTVRTGTSTNTETFTEEFSGSMTMTFDGTTFNVVTDMTVSTNFEANGLTYKVENLVIDTTSGLDISGTFYHPLYGHVDVTTTSTFTDISSFSEPAKYCGGSLNIVGAGGSIDFTADASCSTYDICYTPTSGTIPPCTTGIAWPQ